MKRIVVALLVLWISALAACKGKDRSSPSGPIAFVGDPSDRPNVVRLQPVSVDEHQVVVDVIANGIPSLYGLAFRVTYDPAALRFTEMEPAPDVWPEGSLTLAREGAPGVAVAVLTQTGERDGFAAEDTALARLTFEVTGELSGTALAFRAERSEVRDPAGAVVDATWVGGKFEPSHSGP